ncbi:Nucleoside phosphatase GDA1/CD39 [Metarhizium rileyi]|uniref:Golgi apyrase n=1 Tax=Metarhizium rileyi (strain RCEF 4871) TaxID=1649241 RepID=A0A167G888_METRR|nr:Nucleoside phosphatase GDA1/CD39 [Metarhizium rileyi RCEF 4871]TWU78919.1 Golgi apyrase [Metarhizium rileyi]
MGKNSQYGVILDAGSSGTRLYVYKWKHPISAINHASSSDLGSLPKLKLKRSQKIHPGIATFADDVASIGPKHLQSLISVALDEVPTENVSKTSIFLMATAGVRLLNKSQQVSLLEGICKYLQMNTDFHIPNCEERVQVISGETEGLYGWIATNYLLGGFDRPKEHTHGKGHHTYGFLDMGGASAQIAFAPNTTETERHAKDLKLVRMRRLDGSSAEYKVFTATWLGFGANKARSRYIESLVESYADSADDIPDPCMPKGLQSPTGENLSLGKPDGKTLIGTGAFDECLKKTYPLLRKDAPCEDHPCLLNGQHVPAIDFEVNHFVGVSEYWHSTHGVFGKAQQVYDLASYQQKVLAFCSREWAAIKSDIVKRKKSTEQKVQEAGEACFKASWLINVLYEGIGIPRLDLESWPRPSFNGTYDRPEKDKQYSFSPFQPINTVNGVEVSWTLGKMVLYASGQVSPHLPSLPVGFGSNIASETPSDFEHAGSVPLTLDSYTDNEDSDPDDRATFENHTLYKILSLMFVALLVAFLLQGPDRRRRVLNIWRRCHSTRKSRAAPGLASKLFGRNVANYERILEQGENTGHELAGCSGDVDGSNGSEGSHANRYNGLGAPKVNMGAFDDARQPSVMDRTGLVIRTESREQLAPKLQMLNAGRKSRAASPTRLKSPLMTPKQAELQQY